MTISSSLTTAPGEGALPLMLLRVQVRAFSTFLSFLMGTVTAPQVEFQLETQQNLPESSVEGFCDLRGEEVVQERKNRLGMRGTGRPRRKGGHGEMGQEQKNGGLAAQPTQAGHKPAQWEPAKMAA